LGLEESSIILNQDRLNIMFDAYLVGESELVVPGSFRLLETDKRPGLPESTFVRLLVTAADVLHSWGMPSFGIKIDACPGRISQGSLFLKREGVFYGQCSEICGLNHGFMPISIEAISMAEFIAYLIATLGILSNERKLEIYTYGSKSIQIAKAKFSVAQSSLFYTLTELSTFV